MESRIVELYVIYGGVLDSSHVKELVYTNAPDDVIQNICGDIKSDDLISKFNRIESVIKILQIRGYECTVVKDIPRFGFVY